MQPNSVFYAKRHRIALPEPSQSYEQDAEWFVIQEDNGWKEIRFHDYTAIFEVAGLYEQLFYETLRCDSPRFIRELLGRELAKAGVDPGELRVFDLGAGNGIMGEELRELGVGCVVGADILAAAAKAAARDRPDTYRDYHVLDLTKLSAQQHQLLDGYEFNALTCIAALGFGDIPTACFRTAFNLVADGGWVALNIKEDFLSARDNSGFATLIKESIRSGVFEVLGSEVYQHRLATNRTPLHYAALVGRKRADL
jgi:predicted TPR repeat methyltransferase